MAQSRDYDTLAYLSSVKTSLENNDPIASDKLLRTNDHPLLNTPLVIEDQTTQRRTTYLVAPVSVYRVACFSSEVRMDLEEEGVEKGGPELDARLPFPRERSLPGPYPSTWDLEHYGLSPRSRRPKTYWIPHADACEWICADMVTCPDGHPRAHGSSARPPSPIGLGHPIEIFPRLRLLAGLHESPHSGSRLSTGLYPACGHRRVDRC
ncbi:hypothetical protein QBC34DRAFT_195366 [Podospora aff. communis PSN243]|uniref:Uncharacterized protein n=1 Tax=Podospora aff. communis PSN243 TaxID=3040156 RepID=A0AAV9G5K1_9PEZI|nr:hypothetical protein QBC34DRAFT_195366 [Podospora aff. communis PSN243]